MTARIYPIGIQNFEKLRGDGYVYVDKTSQMYQMVKTGSYYFLSRPRRFGKSLLLSTLKAYFEGKKELFAGLAVERLEKEWNRYFRKVLPDAGIRNLGKFADVRFVQGIIHFFQFHKSKAYINNRDIMS